MSGPTENLILERLKAVKFPGYSRDIVSFGLIKELKVSGTDVFVRLQVATTNPSIPERLKRDTESILRETPGISSTKVVIDITNPLNADYSGLIIGHDTSAAEEISKAVPGVQLVKAFNTIRPASLASLGKPAGDPGRAAIPVAGDNPAARAVVLELADQLGFDGLDAGPLAESWRQQPGTPVYTSDLPIDAARQALADATPDQTANWRS